ncbi:MAG: type II CRISPR RNA-guided endonuclease Cas9 [Cryomorphaceae bacterium]|nr:type II CRISPR RNA-guided endonuclease Cas9 [Cryomorphaceae bacterium]
MKRILGLDLGTTSIGWALVDEAEKENEVSSIVKLGVRVTPLSVDEKTNFEKGNPITTNAERTQKRAARRNLQRYKLRRKNLIELLKEYKIIDEKTILAEDGKNTTHQTIELRAKAAFEKIELNELARVLLAINKKRGYKSSRKLKDDGDGQAIDGMEVAKVLYDEGITPGQYGLKVLNENRKYIPDFYKSDLKDEFKAIWDNQKTFYDEILTDTLFEELQGKNKSQTWAICKVPFDIQGISQKGKANEKKKERYQWRAEALSRKMELEHLAIVLQEINNDLNKSSDYLGAISDRSKELYFGNQTIGQYLYDQIRENKHARLKKQVFYRQDYLDEFERIWETQSKYYEVLTEELKKEIRDVIIFYQRRLKSQKGLISFCQFENWETSITDKETGKKKSKTVGRRVVPKSSPLFQEFKIWQNLNNLEFKNTETGEKIVVNEVDKNIKMALFNELNIRGDLKNSELVKILGKFYTIRKPSQWKANYEKVEGNRTNAALYNVYQLISENEGYGFDWVKKSASEITNELKSIFPEIGINADILDFDWNKELLDQQPSYQLWHLLYSAEEDVKISDEDKIEYGNTSVVLKRKLHQSFGFKPEYAKMLAGISLQPDYGNLSAKAIRKILPFLIDGEDYSKACFHAGYNHSNSLNKEELAQRVLKDKMDVLKKNSLRNPVVEKILNQMVNLVNQVIETYGKPDEIRIELARELKKSAKQRSEMTKNISDATSRNEEIRKIITKEFGVPNPTKNDVIRYRLWKELEARGYKDIFTNTQIKHNDLFSKNVDIEHIIPKALLFDDSFSNKTLAFKSDNLQKADRTAFDFIEQDYNQDLDNFKERVEELYKTGNISRSKKSKLLMSQTNLPEDFIERDLRNSQYIAKKARSMMFEVFRSVVVTSGSITDKLREDWDLINVMKELNLPKYRELGLTTIEERKNNKKIEVIKDWTKRNDHRHHAMDALTVAFTTHNHIQYINNLNARRDGQHKMHSNIIAIEKVITERNENGNRRFKSPMDNFRTMAKQAIESILISFKTKNKVVTSNVNKTKAKDNFNKRVQLTPRGQLHNETVYGKKKVPADKATKISKRFSLEQASLIIDMQKRNLILNHLRKYNNSPENAFDSKTLKKDPILINGEPLLEVNCFEEMYTIRKDVAPGLKIEKIIDSKVKEKLKERLRECNGSDKVAFSDLETNPIWLNKNKGIAIKRVTIKGVSNAEPLHVAKNHLGRDLTAKNNGQVRPSDYVSTSNNHHVAIYKDSDENLHERVVSFYEAVARVNAGLPIIDKTYNADLGWEFQFTMKQNEMFVFPNADLEFDPNEVDLLDPESQKRISPNLFRVQKIATKNYMFRHHLETTVTTDLDFTFRSIRSTGHLRGVKKVRLNHLGKVVQVGEF